MRRQYNTFKEGDIFLEGFCNYFDMDNFNKRHIASVVTLARRKPFTASESLRVLSEDDLLIQWERPTRSKRSSYTVDDWKSMSKTLKLRQIKVTVNQPGFRTTGFYIVTTLLDEIKYPASDIIDLYFQRWDAELYFSDIKTTMGMDILFPFGPEEENLERLSDGQNPTNY